MCRSPCCATAGTRRTTPARSASTSKLARSSARPAIGRISAASRQDYAAAAATALLQDEAGNRTYELGGPAFDVPELAGVITEVTGTKVTYRDLPVEEYASWLQRAGLDEGTAHFVAALDASIARGDLETNSQDLAQLLGRPTTLSPRSSARRTASSVSLAAAVLSSPPDGSSDRCRSPQCWRS